MPDPKKLTIQPRQSYASYQMESGRQFVPLIILNNGKPIEACWNLLPYMQESRYAIAGALKQIASSACSNSGPSISGVLYEQVQLELFRTRKDDAPGILFRLFCQSKSFTEFSQQLSGNQQEIIGYINQLKISDLSQLLDFPEAIEKINADINSADDLLKKRHHEACNTREQGFDLEKTKEWIHLNCLHDEKKKLDKLFYQQYSSLFMKQMLIDQDFAEACASLYQPQLDRNLHEINIEKCHLYGLPHNGKPGQIESVRAELTRQLKEAAHCASLAKVQSFVQKGASVLGEEQDGFITDATTPLIEAIESFKDFYYGRCTSEKDYLALVQYLAELSQTQLYVLGKALPKRSYA